MILNIKFLEYFERMHVEVISKKSGHFSINEPK